MEFVEKFFDFERFGRSKADFFRLEHEISKNEGLGASESCFTHSMWNAGFGTSADECRGGEDAIVTSSFTVWCGVGESSSICEKNGGLCGRGEMSIRSSRPGDDDNSGGVVMVSAHCQHPVLVFVF